MSELLPEKKLGRPDDTTSQEADSMSNKRRRVTSTLQWVECFNTYCVLVSWPSNNLDLLAYASLIVHTA